MKELYAVYSGLYRLIILPVDPFLGDHGFFIIDQVFLSLLAQELGAQLSVLLAYLLQEALFLLLAQQAAHGGYAARSIQHMQHTFIVFRRDLHSRMRTRCGGTTDQKRQ